MIFRARLHPTALDRRIGWGQRLRCSLAAVLLVLTTPQVHAEVPVTLALDDVAIPDVMHMLSRSHRVNILVDEAVQNSVTLNIFDMPLSEAINAIASAGGFAVEERYNSYFIIPREQVGRHADGGVTQVRTFRVQYSDAEVVADIVEGYLSAYGSVTAFAERKLIIVQDAPDFIRKIENLLALIDEEPRQILIEARILEVALDDSQSFGIDWRRLFSADDGTGVVGTQGLAATGAQGFFLEIMNSDIEVIIDALMSDGRARTLSTPKLLTLEDEPASVIVGDRKGYRETTTINQVTTESIRFLESGVILRVTPSVDANNRVRLSIAPEISTGTVSDGIPSQVTTSVDTELLLEDGQTSFIAGLMKQGTTDRKSGIPLLAEVPVVGRLFRNQSKTWTNTETIVLITPRIMNGKRHADLLEETKATLDAQAPVHDF